MKTRKIHRVIGMVLILPLVGWLVTGMVFLIKPGYAGAYEQLSPKYYALGERTFPTKPDWFEVRLVKTILGEHLLVKAADGWVHLDPGSLNPMPAPSELNASKLLLDAVSHNPQRYGTIEGMANGVYITSTGIELSLDWQTLSIRQKGRDTALINTLYKIHYLQWLGNKQANTVLGVVGLVGLFLLVFYGAILFFRGRKRV
ncbi:hypothetical protein KO528_07270 [Saccharophagus degradans]|uniref:hypothetical protein n=1 Tax=Saccharophagus degradans TaxID=86304 RepID=UPI001C09135C|nr:hypothetical protein [Saccharophagus degradans]MBU2985145.1 hypothetical protein [Saccharophagus degradans]